MTSNPYNRNGSGGNPYGGQNPGNQPYGANPFADPQTTVARPFVDPYQPTDNQPVYPPAVHRRDLAGASRGAAAAAAASSVGQEVTTPSSRGGAAGAVACLFLAAFITLGHGAIIALGVAALFYALSRGSFTKGWAANAINLLVAYMVLVVANSVVFGIVDAVGSGHLRHTIGNLLRYVFALVLAGGGVMALMGRFRRVPFSLPALRQ